MRKHKYHFTTDGHYTTTVGERVLSEGAFVLNPDRTPKTVDFKSTAGALSGRTLRCIYEVKDDDLRFCFFVSGSERPTEFTSGPSTGQVLMVYKRVNGK